MLALFENAAPRRRSKLTKIFFKKNLKLKKTLLKLIKEDYTQIVQSIYTF